MEAARHLAEPAPQARAGIDHVVLPVRSYDGASRFYSAALEPLGLTLRLDWPDRQRAHFGAAGDRSALWIVESTPATPVQLALTAPTPAAVRAFYAAALAAGALPRRAPQPYAELTSDAYGAAVADDDGNVLEAIARRRAS